MTQKNNENEPATAVLTPEAKKRFVRERFAAISRSYDFLNSILSFQIDRLWRRSVVRELRAVPGKMLLDLCAGTLPLSLALAKDDDSRMVVAVDFCEEMLRQGRSALAAEAAIGRIYAVCGDGERIPAGDGTFSGCTVAFGVRNLGSAATGLQEMCRILAPGGRLVILEFSRPGNPFFGPLYSLYLNRILPVVGGILSGDREAYLYLARSIGAFYEPRELVRMLLAAGFSRADFRPMSFGIVSIYVADK